VNDCACFCLPVSFNPCEKENGGCSHLCLLAPRRLHSCACPSGVALMSDMKTCEYGKASTLFALI
jgi:hypothetical protein